MQPTINDNPRPPYIDFRQIPIENREESTKVGYPVMQDQDFVEVTPLGSKDKLVKRYDDWIAQMRSQVAEGRIPRQWVQEFELAYAAWKEGKEMPVSGLALKNWPMISPAELENCLRLRLRSVEDLAATNEESIMRLGMGGRALKQRAEEYLAAAKNVGQVTLEMQKVKVENEALKARNTSLEERIAKLEAKAGK